VCRIPWGVCDKLLDNGQRKVALGAIRDLTVQCANTRVADNLVLFAKQLQAIPPAPGVVDYLVLFVSGRSKQLWPIPPTPGWLIIWHYVFLAGHMMNYGGVKGLLQAR
jgi:hypothetical protein